MDNTLPEFRRIDISGAAQLKYSHYYPDAALRRPEPTPRVSPRVPTPQKVLSPRGYSADTESRRRRGWDVK